MPSSHGELTVQLEMRTLRQQSMSMPSRLVSMREVVDREVVDAGGEDAEVAALEDGKIAQEYAAAILQGNGLVADPGVLRFGARTVAFTEALAVDQARADDGNIVQVLAPEERVVPVVMAVVLVGVPGSGRFGGVVMRALGEREG